MSDPGVRVEAIRADLHRASMHHFDHCNHGTYAGGVNNGQPYRACELLARAVVHHLDELDRLTADNESLTGDLVICQQAVIDLASERDEADAALARVEKRAVLAINNLTARLDGGADRTAGLDALTDLRAIAALAGGDDPEATR